MIFFAAFVAALVAALALRPIADIPVPQRFAGGTAGARFDYETIDTRTGRLFIAYLGRDRVLVFDLKSQRFLAAIPGIAGVHGVLAVPGTGRVYASATATNELVSIDARTLEAVARTPAGTYPDGIAYDSLDRRLYVSDETGSAETVVDAGRMRLVRTIDLGGEAGNSQYDSVAHRIIVDVQTRDSVAAIDTDRNRVVARYALAGCTHDHGLLVDAAVRSAFVACDGNDVVLRLDLRTMAVTARAGVGREPDVLALDPALERLYVASESGTVSVFDIRHSALRKVGEGFVAAEAHSIAVDPATHRIYIPLENVDGRAVLRVLAPTR